MELHSMAKLLFINIACILLSLDVSAQSKGLEIAQKYDKAYKGWKSYTTVSTMIMRNQHGQETERKLRAKFYELNSDGDKSMIIFDSPKDVKGTAILTHTHKTKSDDQWLFLPAIKRVKRIASNNKSGPFVGSEFAYEDLGSQEIEKYSYNYVGQKVYNEFTCEVIMRTPVDPKSGYKHMHVYHNPKLNYRIEKIVFYDRKGSKFKTLEYKEYQLYQERYWHPGELLMTNSQTSKETSLVFEDYNFESNLEEEDLHHAKLRNAR